VEGLAVLLLELLEALDVLELLEQVLELGRRLLVLELVVLELGDGVGEPVRQAVEEGLLGGESGFSRRRSARVSRSRSSSSSSFRRISSSAFAE
jgi:hypothetical protein